jgi:hypothetical protein
MAWGQRKPYFMAARVCRRGHVAQWQIALDELETVNRRCEVCGAQIFAQCRNCGARIRGGKSDWTSQEGWNPPSFCDSCGVPHAWVTDEDRIYYLENLLEEYELSDDARSTLRLELDRLRTTSIDLAPSASIWNRIRSASPGFWKLASPIITPIASDELRSLLGLPPGSG